MTQIIIKNILMIIYFGKRKIYSNGDKRIFNMLKILSYMINHKMITVY